MDAIEVIPPSYRPSCGCMVLSAFGLCCVTTLFMPNPNAPSGKSAEQRLAKEQMKGLEIALVGFETEYKVPLPTLLGLKESLDQSVDDKVLKTLMLLEPYSHNPNHIKFYDPPTAKKGMYGVWKDDSGRHQLRDPWGSTYRMRYDDDKDGVIISPEIPPGEPIGRRVAIYSASPDLDFNTWEDNVVSWN